jgi:polysaccharide export outer membrane protein
VAALVAGCAPYRDSALAFDPGPTVYRLDTGDQVRLYVFDQETMSRNYAVDDRGNISIPLVGNIRARGRTSAELERAVSLQLARANIVSDAKVSVEVVGYRPFFIYGEVRGAGRYVYQPNMNVEMALATAGGVTERGNPQVVRLTRIVGGQRVEGNVGLDFPIQPGDTVFVYERWF